MDKPEILEVPAWLRPQLDRYWAATLACPAELLYAKRPVIVESAASPGILGIQIQHHWIFTLHPDSVKRGATALVEALMTSPDSRLPDSAQVHASWQQAGFLNVYGPAYLLYCTSLAKRSPTPGTNAVQRHTGPAMSRADRSRPAPAIDQLGEHDCVAVERFQQEMGVIAWRLGQPSVWPRICGVFDGGQLVATGAIRLWENTIGEIFVDTLPRHRGRGYAKALAGHLTDWMLRETAWIPQYDAEIENLPSLKIAYRLGYQFYGVMLLAESRESMT